MAKAAPETARISPDARERYEPVIGLEVHAQLRTQSKIFCGCSTRFGDPPNSNVCPVCLGLPGTLPVLNRRALELAIRAALALHCTVQERSRFARKNYFYPDLPKGYQISMYELPLAEHGWLDIEFDGGKKHIGITRVHLEEDAAKAMHEGFPDSAEKTYIDYNRCGTPLIEIVSEPDLRTSAEAYAYLTTLKQVLLYTGVSDCNMEEGSLRCDANVSVRRRGSDEFGTKVEVKNLNSFRYLQKALDAFPRKPGCGTRPRTAPNRCARKKGRTITVTFPSPTCCRCTSVPPGAMRFFAHSPSCRKQGARALSAPTVQRPMTPKYSPERGRWRIISKRWLKPVQLPRVPQIGCR